MATSLYSLLYGLSSVLAVGVLALLPLACASGPGDRDSVVIGDHNATAPEVDTPLAYSALSQGVAECVSEPARPDAQARLPEQYLTSTASAAPLLRASLASASAQRSAAPSKTARALSARGPAPARTRSPQP